MNTRNRRNHILYSLISVALFLSCLVAVHAKESDQCWRKITTKRHYGGPAMQQFPKGLSQPGSIVIDRTNSRLFVLDHGNGMIQILTAQFLLPVGQLRIPGGAQPTAISLWKHTLLVATSDQRLWRFDLSPQPRPMGVLNTLPGQACLMTSNKDSIVFYDCTHQSLYHIHTRKPGFFRMSGLSSASRPSSLMMTSSNELFLTDRTLSVILHYRGVQSRPMIWGQPDHTNQPVTIAADQNRHFFYALSKSGILNIYLEGKICNRINLFRRRTLPLSGADIAVQGSRLWLSDPALNQILLFDLE